MRERWGGVDIGDGGGGCIEAWDGTSVVALVDHVSETYPTILGALASGPVVIGADTYWFLPSGPP